MGQLNLCHKKIVSESKGFWSINLGDVALLQSGIDMIEELTQKIPVLGVVPYADIDIDSEDSVALGNKGTHL